MTLDSSERAHCGYLWTEYIIPTTISCWFYNQYSRSIISTLLTVLSGHLTRSLSSNGKIGLGYISAELQLLGTATSEKPHLCLL